eukprot:COSAG01_NODE_9467_length_2438_cov_2.308679_2_plen_54_part_00
MSEARRGVSVERGEGKAGNDALPIRALHAPLPPHAVPPRLRARFMPAPRAMLR